MLVPLMALAIAVHAPAAGGAPSVAGLWKTQGDGGLACIEACGEWVGGRIATPAPPGDPAVEGLLIMKLAPLGPDRWGNGWILNPEDGSRYRASIVLTSDGRLRLRGCLIAPLCRTQTWTRAAEASRRTAVTVR